MQRTPRSSRRFDAPTRNIAALSSSITARSSSTTAPAPTFAASSIGFAIPAALAPRAMAFATSRPDRTPPVPTRGRQTLPRTTLAAVSLRLDDLLEEVQVDDQDMGVDHRHRAPRVVEAVRPLALLRDQLRGPEVREPQRDVVVLHHRVRVHEVGLFESGALRADPHRNADLRGRLCEVRVDLPAHPEAARHRG